MTRTRVDYGLRFDCEKNGCASPCLDTIGDILPRGDERPITERVNGHAVTPVQRTATYSAWEDVPVERRIGPSKDTHDEHMEETSG